MKGVPLIYFHGIIPGKYLAVWPVYIIGDDPNTLTFKIAVDDIQIARNDLEYTPSIAEDSSARRAYITATVKARLHQRGFREKVLHAYRTQCALCCLKHDELLDAAHIIPDNEPDSTPTVTNGIALCKLHHAAFDSFILGISPDYIIHVRKDVLHESDGPMLQHGLKELHSRKIILPSSKLNKISTGLSKAVKLIAVSVFPRRVTLYSLFSGNASLRILVKLLKTSLSP